MTSDGDTGDLIATLMVSGHGDHSMRGAVTVGRDPHAADGSIVSVDGDPLVSKSHFRLDSDGGDLIITDLDSSNGTYLHHEAGETAVPSDRWIPVPPGAEIEFGDQRMTIASAEVDLDQGTNDADPTPDNAARVSDESPADDEPLRCAACDRELPAASKFCDGCGTPVAPDDAAIPHAGGPAATVVIPSGGIPDSSGAPVAPPVPPPSVAPPAAAPPPYGSQALRSPQGPSPQPPPPQGPPPPQYGQSPPAPGVGGPVFVDPAAAPTSTGGGAKKVLVGVGALVVLALVGFGLVSILGGDESNSGGGFELLTVPSELDELWSTEVEGDSGFAGVGDAAVYVAAEDGADVIFTSLSREDGDENWVETIDDADFGNFVGESGDVAVVSVCAFDADTACAVIGLDIDDGDEIWRETIDDGFAFFRNGGLIANDGDGLALLDPATGDRRERIRGEVVFGDSGELFVDDDGEISVLDDDLQPLIGPLDVDPDAGAVAFDGERLVVGIGDEIEYIDAAGDVTPGPFLDGDITGLVAIDDSTIVAELGDEVVVYDVDDGDVDERWSENGTIVQVVDPDGGRVVVVDEGSQRLVIDLESGSERFDVDGELGDVAALPGTNAYAVIDRGGTSDFDGEATLTAYDWTTGDEIWSEDVDGAVRLDEIVVVVETDGDVIAFG